jgi:uncharacterized protein (DUF488 family)
MAEFLSVLQAYGIRTLADVRRFPVSTRYPHFTRENLARAVRGAGIRYVHLGEALGGFRTGGFEDYMATPGFAAGLRSLQLAARRSPTAIMCAERLPWQCHRRFIGRALAQRGWDVVHVIDPGRTWSPGELQAPELPLDGFPPRK